MSLGESVHAILTTTNTTWKQKWANCDVCWTFTKHHLNPAVLFYQPTSFPNISKSPIIYKKNHHPGCPQCGLPTTDKNKRKTKGCCRRKEVEAQACPDSLTSSKCIFYEDDADDDHAIVDTNCQRLNPQPIVIFQLSVDCQLRPAPAGWSWQLSRLYCLPPPPNFPPPHPWPTHATPRTFPLHCQEFFNIEPTPGNLMDGKDCQSVDQIWGIKIHSMIINIFGPHVFLRWVPMDEKELSVSII